MKFSQKKAANYFAQIFLCLVFFAIFFDWGSSTYGGDLQNYHEKYIGKEIFGLASFGYYFLSYLFSVLGIPFVLFRFFLFFMLYFSLMRFSLKITQKKILILLFVLGIFFFPPYQSLSDFILRQGLGFSYLFLTNFFYFNEKQDFRDKIINIIVASLFHPTFLFYFFPLLALKIFRALVPTLAIYVIFVIFYVLDFGYYTSDLFRTFIYLDIITSFDPLVSAEDYVVGFKFYFLLASLLPLIVYLAGYLFGLVFKEFEVELFRFYCFANGLGFLFSGYPYYDRVMLFSWVLIPFFAISFLSKFSFGRRLHH
ncbi:EpsG family protein [Tepidiphilus margaritifer]|uniref:EpsG family protein n=1 Tax=Tepidiphilus margaritifer TaxID=203471 RepID=UPI0012F96D8D|nr:EpsG family protein [Tepidiphilus margaritifer]